MTHGPFLQWSIEDLPSRLLKHQETTCVTADHVRPNNFPISRAIIYHFSWDNFHLLHDNFPFIARYFDFIVRCMRFIARLQKKERKIACPLWATVCFGIVLLIFVTWTRSRPRGLPHHDMFTLQTVTPADRVSLPSTSRPGNPPRRVILSTI